MKNIIEKKPKETLLEQFITLNQDETGAFVKVRYFCPHCSCSLEQLIFIEKFTAKDLICEFEIPINCQNCGESLFLESDLY